MTEIHVFDFDGTLFYSPTPYRPYIETIEHRLQSHTRRHPTADVRHLYGQLMSAPSDGGLGWFQSLATLSPPAVPEVAAVAANTATTTTTTNSSAAAKEWYVTPVIERLRRLGEEAKRLRAEAAATTATTATTTPAREIVIYVLTGRDVKYSARIAQLLAQQGLTPYIAAIFCKPHETAGTVRYKCEMLGPELLWRRHPQARGLYYYEDRREQGGRLAGGLGEWLRRCYYTHELPSPADTHASSPAPSRPAAPASGEGGGVLLVELPLDPAAPLLPPKEKGGLTLLELFGGEAKTLEHMRRQSARWVDTVVASEYYAARCLHGPPPPPPQSLEVVMAFVPAPLADRAEQMLDLEETAAVVDTLLCEKARRQGHGDHSSGRGRGRGRGGGRGGGGRGGRGGRGYF